MKFKAKVLSVVMTFVLLIAAFTPVMAKAEETKGFSIKDVAGKTVILHTNDTHGRVERGTNGSLGITTVAAFKKALIAAGAEVILLDAGDTLHGKPIATVDQGKTIVALMNACGYDAMTLGNHDYNYGSEHLIELVKEMNFPVVAANVCNRADGSDFVNDEIIIEKNGVTYGIFGLSTKETETKTNPKNVSSLVFCDPVKIARSQVNYLKQQDVDVIIALGHIGIDESSDPTSIDILNQVDGIDLFIDGHSHSTDASCAAKNNTDTLLVSNGEYLNTIGCVVVDENKDMTAYAITADDLAAAGVKTTLAEGETEAAVDAEVGPIVDEAVKALGVSLSKVVGTTDIYLDGVRENVRTTETNLGNLAADAIRWASGADVALTNGGGIRTSIEAGNITKAMLAEVFPFGNIVVSKKVTGQAIKDALEHGVKDYPATSGGFPQTSGMTFTIDANKEAGSRISNLKINGEKVDLTKMYVLASNDFTIAGGDGYTMIGDDLFPTLFEFGALDEVLIQYIQTNPAVETYAVGRTLTVKAGETAPATEEDVNPAEEVKPEDTTDADETQSDVVTYTVVKGDCLSSIAKAILGKAIDWKKIYELNKAAIKDPNMIYVGQTLVIE